MNVTKIHLKALVLTTLMNSLDAQGLKLDAEQTNLVSEFGAILNEADELNLPGIDDAIDDNYVALLAAIDSLPEF